MAMKANIESFLNKGYQEAINYPLFDSIWNRRSRRFGLGMELSDTTLAYKSDAPPIPLDELVGHRAYRALPG